MERTSDLDESLENQANADYSFLYNQSLFIKQKDETLLFDLFVFYAHCVYTELFL